MSYHQTTGSELPMPDISAGYVIYELASRIVRD